VRPAGSDRRAGSRGVAAVSTARRRSSLRAVPLVMALTAVAAGVAACGAASSTTPSTTAAGKTTVTSTAVADEVPLPAGKNPSAISKMVCAAKAQGELSQVLGDKTVRVDTPTWVNHLYTCHYVYPNGVMTLSIKELSSWSETLAYFRMLGHSLGDTGSLGNLGQGAFTTKDGSVVVRKDWKVLLVDVSLLPAQFGVPLSPRSDIAVTIADVILGCWAGD
jgi:hypothetical protein